MIHSYFDWVGYFFRLFNLRFFFFVDYYIATLFFSYNFTIRLWSFPKNIFSKLNYFPFSADLDKALKSFDSCHSHRLTYCYIFLVVFIGLLVYLSHNVARKAFVVATMQFCDYSYVHVYVSSMSEFKIHIKSYFKWTNAAILYYIILNLKSIKY